MVTLSSSAGSPRPAAGPAEAEAQRVIARYGATLRGATGLVAGVMGLFTPPGSGPRRVVCLVLITWAIARLIGRRRRSVVWTAIDLVVAVGVAVTTPLTTDVRQALDQQGLVANVVNPANLTLAWFPRRAIALLLSGVVIAAAVAGYALTTGAPFWTIPALYTMPIQAVLSWALVGTFLPAARAADRAASERSAALVDRDLQAARRAAAWEHWTLLHDTAASTLVMVADGVPASADARIRRQAGRDLAAVEQHGRAGPAADVTLVDAVRRTVGESALSVDLRVTGHPQAPAAVTAAVGGALRELLTNVERHAGVAAARVDLTGREPGGFVLVVRDEGAGFVTEGGVPAGRPSTDGTGGLGVGLRESVHGRLRRVGATVATVSSPGRGTTTTVRWDPAARVEPRPQLRRQVPYLRNYSLGLCAVTAVVTVQFAVFALVNEAAPVAPVALTAAMLLTAVAAAARQIVRRRPWHWWALTAWLAAVEGAAVAFTAGRSAHSGNWTLAVLPYVVVVLLLGLRPRRTAPIAAAPVLALGVLLLLPGLPPDSAGPLAEVQELLGLVMFPMAAAGFYPRLAEVGRRAAAADADRAAVELRDRRSAMLATDRADRASVVSTSVVPLLQALADGSADPSDDRVRRAARVESARLRRSFAENDDVDDPLVHELRALIEACERAEVAATLDVHGVPPTLPVDVRRRLLDPPMAVLARAQDRVRVVVDASDEQVSVSVVATVVDFAVPSPTQHDGVTVRYVTHDRMVWVQSTWEGER